MSYLILICLSVSLPSNFLVLCPLKNFCILFLKRYYLLSVVWCLKFRQFEFFWFMFLIVWTRIVFFLWFSFLFLFLVLVGLLFSVYKKFPGWFCKCYKRSCLYILWSLITLSYTFQDIGRLYLYYSGDWFCFLLFWVEIFYLTYFLWFYQDTLLL